jgi:hypothetical protein
VTYYHGSSYFGAATYLGTGVVGCNEKVKLAFFEDGLKKRKQRRESKGAYAVD